MDLFDWQYYLDKNPDLRNNGINTEQLALTHWNNYGKSENRDARCYIFDWCYYLDTYPDLRTNGINTEQLSLTHWKAYGKCEGRLPRCYNFDWKYYLNKYSELKTLGINAEKQALNHWNNHGKIEGRLSFNPFTIPVIVCIAKLESDYIEEFVKYHLALGFSCIYIYDNEDIPTYKKLLENYSNFIKVVHLPGNNYHKGVQYIALDHFIEHFMYKDTITHVAHIDIDEFIILKKHNNISDFINEYIVNDCAGIGMNWRYFGSSNRRTKTKKHKRVKHNTRRVPKVRLNKSKRKPIRKSTKTRSRKSLQGSGR